MITFIMKHLILRVIFHFFKVAEFVRSVDKYQPLLMAQGYLDREGAENIKYISFVLFQYSQASASTKNVQME